MLHVDIYDDIDVLIIIDYNNLSYNLFLGGQI